MADQYHNYMRTAIMGVGIAIIDAAVVCGVHQASRYLGVESLEKRLTADILAGIGALMPSMIMMESIADRVESYIQNYRRKN